MRIMLSDERLTSIYQKLVEMGYEKLEKFDYDFNDPQTFLTRNDILLVSLVALCVAAIILEMKHKPRIMMIKGRRSLTSSMGSNDL